MKSSLFLLAFGTLLHCQAIRDKAFRGRREYVYQYETQVVTGMEPFTSVHSGFRLSATARVQFKTYTKIQVVLDNVFFYRLNKPVVQYQADSHIIPKQFLNEFIGPASSKMVEYLSIPFGFEYVKGHVVRILLSDKETEWSANTKRGFVSLFEVNLEKRMLMEQYSHGQAGIAGIGKVDNYQVMEKAPTGDCATTYSVKPDLPDNHLFVSKVRNFDFCLNRPVYFKSMFDGYLTPNYKKDNPLSVGATVEYSLSGGISRFLILSARAETKFTFSPLRQRGEIRTSVNQTLNLKEATSLSAKRRFEVEPGTTKSDRLRMTLPSELNGPQDPFGQFDEETKLSSSPLDVYPVDAIYAELLQATENTMNLTTQESLVHLRMVVSMLRTSPLETIRKLWEKVYLSREKPLDKLAGKILWNVLPHVGTDAAANHILDVCINKIAHCETALNVLTLKATPTLNIMEKLVMLIESLDRGESKLKQVSYLTLGSLAYKLSVEKHRRLEDIKKTETILSILKRDSNKFIRNYLAGKRGEVKKSKAKIINGHARGTQLAVQTIEKLIEKGSQEDRILGLKSLGNAGQLDSLPVLKKILNNSTEPMFIRIFSILGHRRLYIDQAARKQAIDTLLSVYQNNKETNEIRTMAFTILMSLWPEEAVLTGIAQSLNYEKDNQVSNYVLSYLGSQANSSYTALWELSKNSSDALKFGPVNNADTEYYHPFSKSMGKMYSDYKLGVNLRFKSMGSLYKYEGWALSMDTYVYGLHSSFFEMGINANGAGHVLSKLYRSRGPASSIASVMDILKQSTRSANPRDVIDKIFNTLNIKPRTDNLPSLHFYYKVMGHELGYCDLNDLLGFVTTTAGKSSLNFHAEQLKMSLPVHYNDVWYLHDTQLTLPSEAGLPISLKLQLSTTVKVDGLVTADILPFLSRPDSRRGPDQTKLSFSVDLQPKIVTNLYGSMGLDVYIVKPTLAFRGLLKHSMPMKSEMILDLNTSKFRIIKTLPQMRDPVTEVLIEPFGEFPVLSTSGKTPTVLLERVPIFAPTGTKITPVKLFHDLHFLGYKVGVEGQMPETWGLRTPVRPLSGRTVLNLWFKPLEQAARIITINGQLVLPSGDTGPLRPARDSENDPSARPDRSGSNLPTYVEDTLPLSDHSDLDRESVSMRQLVAKMERICGKPLPSPASMDHQLGGLVVYLDASSELISHKSHIDIFMGSTHEGLYNIGVVHLWRSPIPGYDEKSWEISSSFETAYPITQKEPKDIFDVEWQKQLMKELQALVTIKSHKVVNTVMNRTLLSELERLNYPAMTKVPAFRVISSLVPQLLDRLINQISSLPNKTNWQKYWKTLGPLTLKVEEERKLLLDPYFINRDAILISYFQDLLDVQKTLDVDLENILNLKQIDHAEIPVMQYIVFIQERTVDMLNKIVHIDEPKGSIKKIKYIKDLLQQSKTLLNAIMQKANKIISTVVSLSQEKDKHGRDIVIALPAAQPANLTHDEIRAKLKNDVAKPVFSAVYGTRATFDSGYSDGQSRPNKIEFQGDSSSNDINELIESLYRLSVIQMQAIVEVQSAVDKNSSFDFHHVTHVIRATQANLTLFDSLWKVQPVKLDIIRERMLLVTVQNELLIDLLHQYQVQRSQFPFPQTKTLDWGFYKMVQTFLAKIEGYYLGQRTASTYKFKFLEEVVAPELSEEEASVYRGVQEIYRNIAVEMRRFEIRFAHNYTAMKRPDDAAANFLRFITNTNYYISGISSLQKSLASIDNIPKVYIVSELVETINYLKFVVEFGRKANLPLTYPQRLQWIKTLDKQATRVQRLLSAMSPIFDKFSNYREASSQRPGPSVTELSDAPVDASLVEVQYVLSQQVDLLDSLREFLQDKRVSSDSLPRVLERVLRRGEFLQDTLVQNKVRALAVLKGEKASDRQQILDVIKQAIYQQRSLYKAIRSGITRTKDRLPEGIRMSGEVDSLEERLNDLESDTRQRDVKPEDSFNRYDFPVDDNFLGEEYSRQKREKREKEGTTLNYIPEGITAFVNASWGNEGDMQEMKFQMFACRSLEQIIRIFKQMDATVRSQDIVRDVNRDLGKQIVSVGTEAEALLNSYNHIHFIASFDEEKVPDWGREYSSRVRDFFKMLFWDQYSWLNPEPVLENKLHTIFDVSDINQKLDMFMMDEKDTVRFLGVPLPEWTKAFKFNQNTRSFPRQLVSSITHNFLPAQCVVLENTVRTIDTVVYQIQKNIDKCRTLLAMDCSPEREFAVTMVKSNTTFYGHVLQVVSDDKVIEIQPDYLNVRVKLDGKVLNLIEGVPTPLNSPKNDKRLSRREIITRKGLMVDIELPVIGVSVTMEGSYITIEVSELFKHKICGLCGNFDALRSWEFEGPEREVYTSPVSFATSYVLPGEPECRVSKARHRKTAAAAAAATAQFVPQYLQYPRAVHGHSHLKGSEPLWKAPRTSGTQQAINQTENQVGRDGTNQPQAKDVLGGDSADQIGTDDADNQNGEPALETDIRVRKKRQQTCFSLTPISRCPVVAPKVLKRRTEQVYYVCLKTTDPGVVRLKEQASQGPLLDLDKVEGQRLKRRVRQEIQCGPEKLARQQNSNRQSL